MRTQTVEFDDWTAEARSFVLQALRCCQIDPYADNRYRDWGMRVRGKGSLESVMEMIDDWVKTSIEFTQYMCSLDGFREWGEKVLLVVVVDDMHVSIAPRQLVVESESGEESLQGFPESLFARVAEDTYRYYFTDDEQVREQLAQALADDKDW